MIKKVIIYKHHYGYHIRGFKTINNKLFYNLFPTIESSRGEKYGRKNGDLIDINENIIVGRSSKEHYE